MQYNVDGTSYIVTHTLGGIPVAQTQLVLDDSTPFPDFIHPGTNILTPWTGFKGGDQPLELVVRVRLNDGEKCFAMAPASIPVVIGEPEPPRNVYWCPHCGGSGLRTCANPCIAMAPFGGHLVFERPLPSDQGAGETSLGGALTLSYVVTLFNNVTNSTIRTVTIISEETRVATTFSDLPRYSAVRASIYTVNNAGAGKPMQLTSFFYPAGPSEAPRVLAVQSSSGASLGNYLTVTVEIPDDTGDDSNTRIPVDAYEVEMSPSNFTIPGDIKDDYTGLITLVDFAKTYTVRFLHLAVGNTWYVRARAGTSYGFSYFSSPAVPRQVIIPPSVPRQLQLRARGPNVLSVSFVNPVEMGAGPWESEAWRVTPLEYHYAIATSSGVLSSRPEETPFHFINFTAPKEVCVSADGSECVLPFVYLGVSYASCTSAGNLGQGGGLWCSTTKSYDADAQAASCRCREVSSNVTSNSSLHFEIPALIDGTEYWIAVRARSKAANPPAYADSVPSGVGPWTSLTSLVAMGLPPVPAGISVAANGSSALHLTWTSVAVVHTFWYQIELTETTPGGNPVTSLRIIAVSHLPTSVRLENLQTGLRVSARVRSALAVGTSNYSSASGNATVLLQPSKPRSIVVELANLTLYQAAGFYSLPQRSPPPAASGRALLFGQAPLDTGLYSIGDASWHILSYNVRATRLPGSCTPPVGSSATSLWTISNIAAGVELQGLTPGCNYSILVAAANDAGEGESSDPAHFVLVAPPSPPRQFAVRASGNEELLASWLPPADAGRGTSEGPNMSTYFIRLVVNASGLIESTACDNSLFHASSTQADWSLSSDPLNWMQKILLALTPLPTVTDIRAQEGCGTITLRYTVAAADTSQLILGNVAKGAKVTVSVVAENEAGAGPSVYASAFSLAIPSEPMNMSITASCGHANSESGSASPDASVGVRIIFQPPSDPGIESRVPSGFRYQVESVVISGTNCLPGGLETFTPGAVRYNETVTLAPNFTQSCMYLFRIRALNDAGAGSWSEPLEHLVMAEMCFCSAGYTGPDNQGPCRICVPGTFKAAVGSEACTPCPEHPILYVVFDNRGRRLENPAAFPGWRAENITSPPASVSHTACFVPCPAGFTGPNVGAGEASVCRECEAGSDKFQAGPHACTCRSCITKTCGAPS